jgi:hypothetical protein
MPKNLNAPDARGWVMIASFVLVVVVLVMIGTIRHRLGRRRRLVGVQRDQAGRRTCRPQRGDHRAAGQGQPAHFRPKGVR